MKGCAVVALFVLLIATTWARPEDEKYTDEFDDIDVDEILRSDRLLDNYLVCIKTGKKCTPDGRKLKELIPDALKSDCRKCTDVQKSQSKRVIKFLVENKPKMYKDLEELFDPSREYRKLHEEEFKAEGIILPN